MLHFSIFYQCLHCPVIKRFLAHLGFFNLAVQLRPKSENCPSFKGGGGGETNNYRHGHHLVAPTIKQSTRDDNMIRKLLKRFGFDTNYAGALIFGGKQSTACSHDKRSMKAN